MSEEKENPQWMGNSDFDQFGGNGVSHLVTPPGGGGQPYLRFWWKLLRSRSLL